MGQPLQNEKRNAAESPTFQQEMIKCFFGSALQIPGKPVGEM